MPQIMETLLDLKSWFTLALGSLINLMSLVNNYWTQLGAYPEYSIILELIKTLPVRISG